MTKDQFISLFFIALLLFVVWQIVAIFAIFFKAFFWSAILAFGFYPLFEKLRRRLKARKTVAAFLMTSLIFLLVVPPILFLIFNVAAQAIDLYQSSLAYVREGRLEQLIEQIRAVPFIQHLEQKIFQWEPLKQRAAEWILSSSREIGKFTAAQVGTITKNLFYVFLDIVLMVIMIFIFLKDGETIYQFIYGIAPLEEKNKENIARRINETLSAVIRGQLLTGFIQATAAGFIYWVLGLSLPLFFACLTFLAAFIPVTGAATVWVPLCLYLVTIQEYGRAALLFVSGTFFISLIDNVIKPALIGEKTKLPYFLLFFGILGGLKLYGLMGIFLAPVLLSLFFALVKIYQEKYL